jgi:RHS repeat-associated protein
MLSDGRMLYVPGVGQWDGQTWTYELPDGLGSVRQLADSQGYLVQRYDYSPFGEMAASEGKRTNALRYAGEQWDSDAGLLYLRARWYDPSVGRFTTPDPFPGFVVLPQTQNPYVYVNNNPINLTDPSGEVVPIPVVVIDVGIVVIVVVVAWGGYTFYVSPNAAKNRAAFANDVCQVAGGAWNHFNESTAMYRTIVGLTMAYASTVFATETRQISDGRKVRVRPLKPSEVPHEWELAKQKGCVSVHTPIDRDKCKFQNDVYIVKPDGTGLRKITEGQQLSALQCTPGGWRGFRTVSDVQWVPQ